MIECRKEFPINLKSDNQGEFEINKDKDVLFILSNTPNLMFF
jgi:hypothetical protein